MKDKQCEFCGKLYLPKRNTSKFCSAICKTNFARGKQPSEVEAELLAKPTELGLPTLEGVDRTKAFTEEQMILVRQLPRALWIAYMERPNSAEVMTPEERLKHYVSKNYPPFTYK